MWRSVLLGLGILLASGLPLHADEVTLTGGTQLTGVVLERNDESLRLLLPEGVEIRFAGADIASVRRDPKDPRPGTCLRFQQAKDADLLETAVVHLLDRKRSLRVDLIGVTHLADPAYYREIQALLERVDVVLYEAVKPEGSDMAERVEQAAEEGLGRIQSRLAEFLGLVFQTSVIRYDRPHFVHADLSLEEFQELSSAAGGGVNLESMARLAKLVGPMLDAIVKLGRRMPALQVSMKRTLAQLLARSASDLAAMLPPETAKLLIDRRNDVVLEKLDALGDDVRTVAVLYGAGHLADLERRLTEVRGLERVGARWLTAWRIATK